MVLDIVSAPTMNQNSIFRSTRWRLTVFYTGVITILFLLCGFGVWQAIVHAQTGIKPDSLPLTRSAADSQQIEDRFGDRYQQFSLPLSLHNVDDEKSLWGYMDMGRSWQEFDDYLASLRRTIFWATPIIILMVIAVSWYLAGLAMKPLYQSYSQIQQFTTDAAHELRTPLAAVRATLERQNLRLSELVGDLLFLSRLDRQMLAGDREVCVMQDIIADIEEELAALALQKRVTLTRDIQLPTPVEVIGNEEQLYRAIFNLVANAINYTPSDGQITIALSQSDRKALTEQQNTKLKYSIASIELWAIALVILVVRDWDWQ